MSAIIGLYRLDGQRVDRAEVERMVECLAHRGPDGAGLWNEGTVGLGHRMLWTTPESLHEELPLTNKTGSLVLTADARIDNRDELIANFGLKDRPQDQITDSELILQAYERWGERCPEKLVGDFAFAIWDRRKQVLFCARDHFGVKPFYCHYRDGRVFVFASEIKALLCLQEVPRQLNEVRVAEYFDPALLMRDKASTFYQDILRLPPAHTMTVSQEGVAVRPYWALDSSRELRLGSEDEYAEAFREIFTESVRCRLRSALPVGSMLSGGLDSSSIVCTARQLLEENEKPRLHTFSAVYDALPQCDERPYINEVLAQGGVEPRFVQADRESPLSELERVLWHQDEAFYGPNLYMHWALYRAAEEQRVRVLLDGFDGDTTISHGVGRLAELAQEWRWSALAAEVIGLSRNVGIPAGRILWNHVLVPLAPESARRAWRVLRGRRERPWDSIVNPDFAWRINLGERVTIVENDVSKLQRTSREDHWRRLTSALIPYALEIGDRAASAFLISPAFPFFDKRLAELCLAFPAEQKLSRGWTRLVMRRAMAKRLPEKVQWRGGKTDLSPMVTRGLLAFNRERIEEVIVKDLKLIEAYVNVAVLQRAYARYLASGTEKADQADVLAVWKAVVLATWLRRTGLLA